MSQSIIRSVWSFWSKPFQAHRHSTWFSEKHHLLSWILSLETARKHYPKTMLVTDDTGSKMFIDGMGLDFDFVSTELNELKPYDPDWWVLGKLWAYRCQTEPFVHIDNDVFLWKALPDAVTKAPVLAQNPEYFIFGEHHATCWWYRPEIFDERVKMVNGWLPDEWNWYVANRRELAYCTGILGGNHVDFISHYADLALKIATHPRNQEAFSLMENKIGDCLLIEQYLLAACLEYHNHNVNSKFQNVQIECLFQSPEAAFSSSQPEKVGYTHLIGGTKQNQEIAQRLEKRVAEEYPTQYKRCLHYLNTIRFLPATHSSNILSSQDDISQESLIYTNYLKMPVYAAAGSTLVDNQALVKLFTQLSSVLRDRLARQSLFVNASPSDLDRTLIYFALQDVFQVCSTGIVQARTNNINNADAIQLLLTLAEFQERFLTTLDQYGNPSDSRKTDFINEYHRSLGLLKDEAAKNNLINTYLHQQRISCDMAADLGEVNVKLYP